jgi:hypothetical protein
METQLIDLESEGLVANSRDYGNLYRQLQLAKPRDIKTLLTLFEKGPKNLRSLLGNFGLLSKLMRKVNYRI